MIRWENGMKIWCRQGPYNNTVIHSSEEDARDSMTRKDTLFSFVVSDLKEEAEGMKPGSASA